MMRVLFVASELYPFVKTGGLGDVAAALPVALKKQGVDIRLLIPGYPEIIKNLKGAKKLRSIAPFFAREDAQILTGQSNGIEAYVLDCKSFYDRATPYGDENGKDWDDNHLRFAALARVAADIGLYDAKWQPDVIHGNDWQCGLIPAYLSFRGKDRPKFIMTIHNMAYQGLFPRSVMPEINLPADIFRIKGIEFYGKVSFMKAGLQYADKITTVSPTYAIEIQHDEFGCGLDGLLRERSQDVVGILNGMDDEIWNPFIDKDIAQIYDTQNLKDKLQNRDALIRETELSVEKNLPVFGVISRQVEQKGLDLLIKAAPEVLKMGAAFVVLGSGDKKIEKEFAELAKAWPAQIFISTVYDEAFAHKIIAGADAVVVPSRFEPCGLVQIYALKYGTLPIVRKTGGLADTVFENESKSTGFVFDKADVESLSNALIRTCALYRSKTHWKKRQLNAMAQDFGWHSSAKSYIQLYQELK